MSNPNIANYGKNTQIKKGEVRNPTGQPRKSISFLNTELSERGIYPATRQDIEANFMLMIQLGEQDLKDLSNDTEKPVLVQILAKSLLSGKGFDIVEKILDRGIGKATQKEEREVRIVDIADTLTPEQKTKIAKQYQDLQATERLEE